MSKVKDEFVRVQAMKACGGRGGIHKITNRSLCGSERSVLIPTNMAAIPIE
jgi:hypothetical protein